MRRFVSTVNASSGGTTYGVPYIVDNYNNPCNIGIGVTGTDSSLYTVQHTFADPFSVNLNTPTSATWFNSEGIVSATGNQDTNYAFPPSAIRLALHAVASAQATMAVIQAGVVS